VPLGVPALDPDPVDVAAPAVAEGVVPLDALVWGATAAPPLTAGAGDPTFGTNRPVRFQKAEKPLNGPPTTWLDHRRTYVLVAASKVPVTGVVLFGEEPSGLGDPWLNSWLFHDTPKLCRFPLRVPPLSTMDGTGTWSPVWGSTGLVAVANFTPSKGTGVVIWSANALPEESKAGVGCGWYEPVTSPPAEPGESGV
jgi:hypothetical protein